MSFMGGPFWWWFLEAYGQRKRNAGVLRLRLEDDGEKQATAKATAS
jgi:hypothetical protein